MGWHQNSNAYTHVFEVQLFNGAIGYVVRRRVTPEIDMAAIEPEVHISLVTGTLDEISQRLYLRFRRQTVGRCRNLCSAMSP